jgi:hypothetical protein
MEQLTLAYALVVGIGAVCILIAFVASDWALKAVEKSTSGDESAPAIKYPVAHRQSS